MRRPGRILWLLAALALFPRHAASSLIPVWQKTWSTTAVSSASDPLVARELSDGSTMVVGTGVVAIRYDANGSILSTAVFSPPRFAPTSYTNVFFVPASVVEIDAAGTVFVASCSNPSDHRRADVWLMAYDGRSGEQLWANPAIFDSPGNQEDIPTQILIGPDGNPVVIGYQYSPQNVFAAKFDRSSGALVWGPVMGLGGSGSYAAVEPSGDVILGFTNATQSSNVIEIYKISGQDGTFVWGPVRLGDTTQSYSVQALRSAPDGGFFVAANHSGRQFFKYSGSNGGLLWGPITDADPSAIFGDISVTAANDLVVSTRSSGHFTLTEYAGATGNALWGPVLQAGEVASQMAVRIGADGSIVASASTSNGTTSELDTWKFAAATGNLVWGPRSVAGATFESHPPVLTIRSDGRIFGAATVSQNLVGFERDPATGNFLWGPTGFSATFPVNGTVMDVTQGPDGSVFVTGYAIFPGDDYRWVTIKYDRASGAVLWGPIYNDVGSYSKPDTIRTDAAGNAFVLGFDPNVHSWAVVKYAAATGALLWKATPSDASSTRMAVDTAGDVGLTGSTTNDGYLYQFSTVKISGSNGATLWGPVLYSRASDRSAFGDAIAITPSGAFVVSGYAFGDSAHPNDQWVTIEYSGSTGAVLWGPAFLGDDENGGIYVQDLAVGADGNPVVVGGSQFNLGYRMTTIKYSGATGAPIWGPALVNNTDPYDQANAAAIDSHGDVFVTGYLRNGLSYDFGTIKYRGTDGAVLWGPMLFDGPAAGEDVAYALALDGADNPIVAGNSLNAAKTNDIVAVAYDGATGIQMGAPATLGGWRGHDLPLHNMVARGTSVVLAGTSDTFVTAAYQVTNSIYCDPSSPPPVASIASGPACVGGTVQLNASGYPGATYAWTGSNGFVSALQSPTFIATAAAGGTYSVLIHAYGCTLPTATTELDVHPLLSAIITASPIPAPPRSVATASVPDAGPDATYSWYSSASILGNGTRSITFSTPTFGPVRLTVIVTNSNGCTQTGTLDVPVQGADFYTLSPCRLIDTRGATGPLGAPSLVAGGYRGFGLSGACGIPASARAVSLNVAVVGATDGPGFVTIYPWDNSLLPTASILNYRAGQIRANNAIVALSNFGGVVVYLGQGTGTADLVVDVNGYFQ